MQTTNILFMRDENIYQIYSSDLVFNNISPYDELLSSNQSASLMNLLSSELTDCDYMEQRGPEYLLIR